VTVAAAEAAVHGLVIDDGRLRRNWGLSRGTRPAVYVEPVSYADVQAVVRDGLRFPSPVHAVGAMLSVTDTTSNDGGTLICTRKLDDILGLETDAAGRQVVRVQAGCRLKKLNRWLQARGLEVPFQAEIGEATVGSVSVGDTKDSSLDGPGYFSAHVTGISYVDEEGSLRTLTERDGAPFHELKCSYGLSGVVVECQVEVRPAILCRSDTSIQVFPSPEALAEGIARHHGECDALLATVILHHLAVFFDQRYKAGSGAVTPAESQPACEEFRGAKRLGIQRGFKDVAIPQPRGIVYARHDFVNEYSQPVEGDPRLDFQYYEHDISNLQRVMVETYAFTKQFEKQTGFAPSGWATYFVHRPDRERKPFGLYSGGPGLSFSFDPVFWNPIDPLWQEFAKAYNRLALGQLGGAASPIQTQWLETGDVAIPQRLARRRFATEYYKRFLV